MYKTFICYRGSSIGHTVSKQIAAHIYSVIKDEPRFGGVFYGGDPQYDFMQDTERIIKNAHRFIIVLCTNFFSNFFVRSHDSEDFIPNKESVTMHELHCAFESNCELHPVFSGEFKWETVDKDTMSRLMAHFGKENMEKLMHRANVYEWNQVHNDPNSIIEKLAEDDFDSVLRFLRGLPDENTREFELDLTKYMMKNNTAEMREWLKSIIYSDKLDERVRYYAFYAVQIMLRHIKDYDEMKALLDKYEKHFEHHSTFSHIWLLFLSVGQFEFDKDKALKLAWEDSEMLSDNAGYVHMFPSLYARICETVSAPEVTEIKKTWGERAKFAAKRAIELDKNYAKYYCTLARVHCIEGDYDNAMKQIDQAVTTEDSTRNDYFLRLADYQYYKIMIQMERRFHRGQVKYDND